MIVTVFIGGLILCLMIGAGIGKLRYEIEKFLKRRKRDIGLIELTPKMARKLEKKHGVEQFNSAAK
jgi:hypothetical protein